MKPHPRIRKTIKWGGAVVTVLLVVVWVGSGWWYVGWASGGMEEADLAFGRVRVRLESSPSGTVSFPKGWRMSRLSRRIPMQWRCEVTSGGAVGRSRIFDVWIPLWIPVCIASALAAVAWRLDTLARRRARLNLCPKCNYDRAGIAGDAKCPECGGSPA
jgi:hypothetical protein